MAAFILLHRFRFRGVPNTERQQVRAIDSSASFVYKQTCTKQLHPEKFGCTVVQICCYSRTKTNDIKRLKAFFFDGDQASEKDSAKLDDRVRSTFSFKSFFVHLTFGSSHVLVCSETYRPDDELSTFVNEKASCFFHSFREHWPVQNRICIEKSETRFPSVFISVKLSNKSSEI